MTVAEPLRREGRLNFAAPLRDLADLRSGDRVFFRFLGKGRLEVRAFPRMTWDEVVARYGNNEPIADIEEMLRQEERRLVDEFR